MIKEEEKKEKEGREKRKEKKEENVQCYPRLENGKSPSFLFIINNYLHIFDSCVPSCNNLFVLFLLFLNVSLLL